MSTIFKSTSTWMTYWRPGFMCVKSSVRGEKQTSTSQRSSLIFVLRCLCRCGNVNRCLCEEQRRNKKRFSHVSLVLFEERFHLLQNLPQSVLLRTRSDRSVDEVIADIPRYKFSNTNIHFNQTARQTHRSWIGNRFDSQSDWTKKGQKLRINLVKVSFRGQEVSCLFQNVKIGTTLTLKAGSCPSLIRWSSRINSIDFSQNIVTTKKILKIKLKYYTEVLKVLATRFHFAGNRASCYDHMTNGGRVGTNVIEVNKLVCVTLSWEVTLRLVDSFRL